jgi:PhnB protein
MGTQQRLLNPYLNFPGTAEEAFNFYKTVLGGEMISLQRFSDTPDGGNVPEAEKGKIMHMALKLNDGTTLMASDNVESMGMPFNAGNNFSLSLHPESEAEADRLFNGLSEGGKVTMALEKTFWNAYFGMFTDKFGVNWLVNYSYPEENK